MHSPFESHLVGLHDDLAESLEEEDFTKALEVCLLLLDLYENLLENNGIISIERKGVLH